MSHSPPPLCTRFFVTCSDISKLLSTYWLKIIQSLTADPHNSAASSRLNGPTRRFKWTRPFRAKDVIWFLRVCHHISNAAYQSVCVEPHHIHNTKTHGGARHFRASTDVFRTYFSPSKNVYMWNSTLTIIPGNSTLTLVSTAYNLCVRFPAYSAPTPPPPTNSYVSLLLSLQDE